MVSFMGQLSLCLRHLPILTLVRRPQPNLLSQGRWNHSEDPLCIRDTLAFA